MATPTPNPATLRSTINTSLPLAILSGNENDPITTAFRELTYGTTNPQLLLTEILSAATASADPSGYFTCLTPEILFLAAEYPFLQPHLVALIKLAAKNSTEVASQFVSSLATTRSDSIGSMHAATYVGQKPTRDEIDDFLNTHQFTARILGVEKLAADTGRGAISGIDDALFVLVTGLEEGEDADSHGGVDIDVPAAAYYVIHAGMRLYEACARRLGHDKAASSPLWACRGKHYTGVVGMNLERWSFWKDAFAAVAGSESTAAEGTRKIARTAGRAMDDVEIEIAGARLLE